jgi:uncharacterized protein (DUF427 family)
MNRRLEPLAQRVRARLGKHLLLDTTNALLFFEDVRHPWRAIPRDALRVPLIGPPVADAVDGHWWAIDLDDAHQARAVRAWDTPPPDCPELTGVLVIHHEAADQWLEEEQPVPGMPRNPYHRVDTLPASRHVEVRVQDELVAITRRPTLVVETGLPPRWYVPPGDVRWDRLTPNPRRTVCQYKGTARYWTVDHTDPPVFVWSYPEPLPETAELAGLIGIVGEESGVDLHVNSS